MEKILYQQTPGTMLRLVLSRARNAVYYCIIDDRPRAQYMHVFRSLRKDVRETLGRISEDSALKERWTEPLVEILKIIPPKCKSEDCRQIANNLGVFLERKLNITLA